MSPKVLIVLTSAGEFTTKPGHPTGWYLPEFAHPWNVLKDKVELTIASPKGGEAPVDPSSVEAFASDAESASFLKEQKSLWTHTRKLSDLDAADYDAVFYVGGHGPMFDLFSNKDSLKLIQDFSVARKPIAAVCHGSAALIKATNPSGQSILAGAQVTGFSNTEEDQAQLSSLMPFMLETELNKVSNGGYVKADNPWAEKVVVSKAAETGAPVITGQNPASGTGVGKAILAALNL